VQGREGGEAAFTGVKRRPPSPSFQEIFIVEYGEEGNLYEEAGGGRAGEASLGRKKAVVLFPEGVSVFLNVEKREELGRGQGTREEEGAPR